MQRAAYVHYCLLGDSSPEVYAFYCDGCGLQRVGVSKVTVKRHKTPCAGTSLKRHVSARI